MIRKIEGTSLPENAVLLTLDVSALYTNILHTEAYRVVSLFLDQRNEQHPPTHFLLEILELILEKNYFRFMHRHFLQIKGITMDLATAPSIVNLFMSISEQEYIFTDTNPFLQNILFFKRYIDDLVMIYAQENSVLDFIQWLNTLDANIQFTGHLDHNSIPFLDVNIYRDADNRTAVKPFKKPTDRNTYLHFQSFYLVHLRNNLPYSQFLRLKRNSTMPADFDREAQTLYGQLEKRGFPSHILNKAIYRTRNVPRSSLLHPKDRTREEKIIWALDYTPKSNQIRRVSLKHWHLLKKIPGCAPPKYVYVVPEI